MTQTKTYNFYFKFFIRAFICVNTALNHDGYGGTTPPAVVVDILQQFLGAKKKSPSSINHA